MLGGQELYKKVLTDKTKRHFNIDIDIDQLKKKSKRKDDKKYGKNKE